MCAMINSTSTGSSALAASTNTHSAVHSTVEAVAAHDVLFVAPNEETDTTTNGGGNANLLHADVNLSTTDHASTDQAIASIESSTDIVKAALDIDNNPVFSVDTLIASPQFEEEVEEVYEEYEAIFEDIDIDAAAASAAADDVPVALAVSAQTVQDEHALVVTSLQPASPPLPAIGTSEIVMPDRNDPFSCCAFSSPTPASPDNEQTASSVVALASAMRDAMAVVRPSLKSPVSPVDVPPIIPRTSPLPPVALSAARSASRLVTRRGRSPATLWIESSARSASIQGSHGADSRAMTPSDYGDSDCDLRDDSVSGETAVLESDSEGESAAGTFEVDARIDYYRRRLVDSESLLEQERLAFEEKASTYEQTIEQLELENKHLVGQNRALELNERKLEKSNDAFRQYAVEVDEDLQKIRIRCNQLKEEADRKTTELDDAHDSMQSLRRELSHTRDQVSRLSSQRRADQEAIESMVSSQLSEYVYAIQHLQAENEALRMQMARYVDGPNVDHDPPASDFSLATELLDDVVMKPDRPARRRLSRGVSRGRGGRRSRSLDSIDLRSRTATSLHSELAACGYGTVNDTSTLFAELAAVSKVEDPHDDIPFATPDPVMSTPVKTADSHVGPHMPVVPANGLQQAVKIRSTPPLLLRKSAALASPPLAVRMPPALKNARNRSPTKRNDVKDPGVAPLDLPSPASLPVRSESMKRRSSKRVSWGCDSVAASETGADSNLSPPPRPSTPSPDDDLWLPGQLPTASLPSKDPYLGTCAGEEWIAEYDEEFLSSDVADVLSRQDDRARLKLWFRTVLWQMEDELYEERARNDILHNENRRLLKRIHMSWGRDRLLERKLPQRSSTDCTKSVCDFERRASAKSVVEVGKNANTSPTAKHAGKLLQSCGAGWDIGLGKSMRSPHANSAAWRCTSPESTTSTLPMIDRFFLD